MKKFGDAKMPLTMLKIKLQLKAEKNESFIFWKDEIDKLTKEQNKFFEKLEMEVALADAIDYVQAFLVGVASATFRIGVFTCSSLCTKMCTPIYIYICICGCVCTCTRLVIHMYA